MKMKEWMQKRIERNAVVSELDGEKVILKKSTFPIIGGEWKQINPPLDENGNWNYINLLFGGKRNFIILIAILAIVAMVLFQFYEVFSFIKALQAHSCYPAFKQCVRNTIG